MVTLGWAYVDWESMASYGHCWVTISPNLSQSTTQRKCHAGASYGDLRVGIVGEAGHRYAVARHAMAYSDLHSDPGQLSLVSL